jgi:hypothetical protein
MSIQVEVKRQIQQCLAPNAGSPPHRFEVPWSGGSIAVTLQDAQPLGCALWELELRDTRLDAMDAKGLADVGQRLAQRVRYLLEPLQVHEIDPTLDSVQLRSTPPERDGGTKTVRYYEALLQRDGGLRLVRFEKQSGQSRAQVPAVVTMEVLQKLCQDLHDLLP